MSDRMQIQFQAIAVAMRAKVADLPPRDVDELLTRTQQMLEADDPLCRAVTSFATQYEIGRHEPDRLFEIGEDLHRAALIDARPVPPDLHRRDIHG